MGRIIRAVALCRVSSTEQLENNSLNRQREAVLKAAEELGVKIPEDCWWSGSVSSKQGTNINRKDLNEIIERCKKDKCIRYVIVDEPDRFMRSIDEAAFFEVTFRNLGVQVWYASDPELNKASLTAKLLKFTKYLSAEGSNEERQRKSINGQTQALREGRYPFSPKPGYKRGYERGIQEVHPVRGPALRDVLVRIANHLVTPSQGLVELNKSEFISEHAPYKMDKFRVIATDSFYAGIVEINKQVQVRNENGLHEALITKEQHHELVRIFDAKKKNQSGPRKNGNPKYPCNNIVVCKNCREARYGRVVGYDLTNGHSSKIYEKYRCRACMKSLSRDELHKQITQQFKAHRLSKKGREALISALNKVWKQKEGEAVQEAVRLEHKIKTLGDTISAQAIAAIEPGNRLIKDEIMDNIVKKKAELIELEESLVKLQQKREDDMKRFLRFAFDFIDNMGANFLEISQENRLRCKQVIFPGGFYLDETKKVYTPEISPLITLAAKKKSTEVLNNSHLVRVRGL